MSRVQAAEFDFHTVGIDNGVPYGTKIVRLTNGRELGIDQDGVFDTRDANLSTGECKPSMGFISWDELLYILDGFRAEGGN